MRVPVRQVGVPVRQVRRIEVHAHSANGMRRAERSPAQTSMKRPSAASSDTSKPRMALT